MKYSLYAALAISLSLASCAAKNAPSRVNVKVADTYSGQLHLRPCQDGAKDPVVVDERGNGDMAVCPYGDLVITVVKPSKTVYITSDKIRIERTGDGIPVAISADVP